MTIKNKTKAPETFSPTPEQRTWAGKLIDFSKIDWETEKFLDYHRAHGSTFLDWNAAWRNWIRNVRDYAKGQKPYPNQPVSAEWKPAQEKPWIRHHVLTSLSEQSFYARLSDVMSPTAFNMWIIPVKLIGSHWPFGGKNEGLDFMLPNQTFVDYWTQEIPGLLDPQIKLRAIIRKTS